MGILDSNKILTRSEFEEGTLTTGSFQTTKTLHVTNSKKYRYLTLKISSADYADDVIWDCTLDINIFGRYQACLDELGGYHNRIKRNRVYFVDTMYDDDIILYFHDGTEGVSKTITVDYTLGSQPPLLQEARPITKLFTKEIILEDGVEEYNITSLQPMLGYKYYFFSVRMTTSSGSNAPMTFSILEQRRDTYTNLLRKDDPRHTLAVGQDTRALNTEWFPVTFENGSYTLSIQNPVAGYKAYVNIFGVR